MFMITFLKSGIFSIGEGVTGMRTMRLSKNPIIPNLNYSTRMKS